MTTINVMLCDNKTCTGTDEGCSLSQCSNPRWIEIREKNARSMFSEIKAQGGKKEKVTGGLPHAFRSLTGKKRA